MKQQETQHQKDFRANILKFMDDYNLTIGFVAKQIDYANYALLKRFIRVGDCTIQVNTEGLIIKLMDDYAKSTKGRATVFMKENKLSTFKVAKMLKTTKRDPSLTWLVLHHEKELVELMDNYKK